jgi:hypothetical protein
MNNATVNFTSLGFNIPKGEIYVNLLFKDWKIVSSLTVSLYTLNLKEPDIMRVKVLQNMNFMDKKTLTTIYFTEG